MQRADGGARNGHSLAFGHLRAFRPRARARSSRTQGALGAGGRRAQLKARSLAPVRRQNLRRFCLAGRRSLAPLWHSLSVCE